jgi:predicted Rossmann fold flavoprotein
MASYDTIIIGGGASGMMAAIAASRNGESVLIIEKNKGLGEKLKITGGGRCNIWNAEYDQNKLLRFYGQAEKYLRTSFAKFGLEATEDFFKNLGIETKVEDRNRAFPKSEKAIDVYNALYKEIVKNNISIMPGATAEKIFFKDGNPKKVSGIKIKGSDEILIADKYILSTGGYSHPETGSTGDGFKFLADQGIVINKPNPSLVPLSVTDGWVKKLTGRTIENIKLTFFVDKLKKKVLKHNSKENLETKNRILFTHFGLSGPTILNNSANVGEWLQEGDVILSIDLFPELDEKQLNDFLLNIFNQNLNKTVKNVLNDIYPGNILDEIFTENLTSFSLEKKVNDIRIEERKEVIQLLKNLKINIDALMGFDKAIIASGGIDISEINFFNHEC